jgi:hypothetical protein
MAKMKTMFRETTLNWYITKDGSKRARLICPVCGKETAIPIHYDTVIKNFPLICAKHCRSLTIISYEKGIQRTHIRESRQNGAYRI